MYAQSLWHCFFKLSLDMDPQTSVDADTMTSDLRDFYCARGIEILTPRWTANDAKYYGIEPPPEVRVTITERASTSPIWDTHGKGAKVKFNRE